MGDEEEMEEKGAPRLRRNPHILLVLNIKSYAGGSAPRLWQASVLRHGVDPPVDPHLLKQNSHPGDGKLDVLTLRVAAEVISGSVYGGRRIFTGAPLYFDFHAYEDEDNVGFFNIDGEFYKIRNPVSLSIVLGGKLNVLHTAESMARSHDVHPKHIESDTESSEDQPLSSWFGCCGAQGDNLDDWPVSAPLLGTTRWACTACR